MVERVGLQLHCLPYLQTNLLHRTSTTNQMILWPEIPSTTRTITTTTHMSTTKMNHHRILTTKTPTMTKDRVLLHTISNINNISILISTMPLIRTKDPLLKKLSISRRSHLTSTAIGLSLKGSMYQSLWKWTRLWSWSVIMPWGTTLRCTPSSGTRMDLNSMSIFLPRISNTPPSPSKALTEIRLWVYYWYCGDAELHRHWLM